MRTALIYDYETFGQDPRVSPVICLGMYKFDLDALNDRPHTIDSIVADSKLVRFDVAEQVAKYGKVVEQATVEWWKNQSEEAQTILKPTGAEVSIDQLETVFKDYIGDDELQAVYTRGNTFDPIFTTQLIKDIGGKEPYPWWIVRDTRSMIEGMAWGSDLRSSFMPPEVSEDSLVLHDPCYDIALDVMRLQSLAGLLS